MIMEFKIAEAIHAEREAERNRVIEGITVQKTTLAERFMLALRTQRRNRATQKGERLAGLTRRNVIAR